MSVAVTFKPGDRVCAPERFHNLVVREIHGSNVVADFRSGFGWVDLLAHSFVHTPPCSWCTERGNLP